MALTFEKVVYILRICSKHPRTLTFFFTTSTITPAVQLTVVRMLGH
jgi:hypothetical protein